MEKITVYQKPTCSKCRTTLELLKDRGIEFEAVNYYEQHLSAEQLRGLVAKLGVSPADLLRKDEPIAKSLGIGTGDYSDDELIDLMVQNPDLIQRPIVVRGEKAVICRPPQNVEVLL